MGMKTLMNGKTKKMSVIDIGCGVGADLMKYYTSRVKDAVFIDINYAGLFSAGDSATSRYTNLRNKYP
jgi:ubiquinone/menaquinone biosynthesis C-methylase UbiE